jgi:rhamnose transport system ATP-binding protein
LDEPTAALTPSEAEHLFATVRKLRDQGTAVLIITHRLEELYGLVDRVTVLRDGNHISTLPIKEVDREGLIRLMVGRPLNTWLTRSTSSGTRGEIKLRVSELSQTGVFKNVSFELYGGEIVGMAGLVGSGRSEIAQAIFGISSPTSGKVFLNGKEVQGKRPDELVNMGLAYLPEKRDTQGLITQFSISNNITLALINHLSKGGVLRGKRELMFSQKYATDLDIKAPSLHQPVSALSGGNRQKVVFAKWLSTRPEVFILDEPTQGIDIGTKVQVHKRIRELAQQGMAVLLISSDLPEVLALSDRVLVVSKGKLTAELNREEATQERVMSAAIKETGII